MSFREHFDLLPGFAPNEHDPNDLEPDPEYDEGPYVCPGCYAVGEPCYPGCIDAEIEADRERERYDYDDDPPWECDE